MNLEAKKLEGKEIELYEVSQGKMDGKIVWITDYRYRSLDDKPLRHVKPTKVMVRSNTETNKRIYYSNSHFVKIGAKGQPTKQIIRLFDATGYRSYPGTAVRIFDNEDMAMNTYGDFCQEIKTARIKRLQEIVADHIKHMAELNKYVLV